MKISKKRLLAAFMTASMLTSSASFLATDVGAIDSEASDLNIQHSFSQNGYTFEKVSHASSGTEEADGVIDYLGDRNLEAYVDGVSEIGNADSVQSYSYCAAAHGDWVYIGTMYGALSAFNQIKNSLGDVPPEVSESLIDVMFNGKLNRGQEEDGFYAGSVFFKINVKTGETKILMSREMYEHGECTGVPIFRSACEYNGKLYFVGLVSNGTALNQYNGMPLPPAYALNLEIMMQTGIPSIYEVDPETDEVKCVYECVTVDEYRILNGNMDGHSVFTSTRAIGTYKDYLIAGGIQVGESGEAYREDGYANGDAVILATNDPASGDFKVIANMADLYDYPAIWRDGSSGGGGIYQVVEYNDSLYIAIVSGTRDTMNETTRQFRPFAVVRGDYDASVGSVDDRNAWTWTPVIGDKDDGAAYTFGIDPERTASSACTMQVYNDCLYIGEYNDVNGSLNGILSYKEFATLAANLEQSINLYRLDADENIEMIVGDATAMFPDGSLSGWGSGYETHMTQYTWMTTVYDDVMYLSTMDETSLTRPISEVVSGSWMNLTEAEWRSQMMYVEVMMEIISKYLRPEPAPARFAAKMIPSDEAELNAVPETISQEEAEDILADAICGVREKYAGASAQSLLGGSVFDGVDLTDSQMHNLLRMIISGVFQRTGVDEYIANVACNVNQALEMLSNLYGTTDIEDFVEIYRMALETYRNEIRDRLPSVVVSVYDQMLNLATLENFENLLKAMFYMKDAEAGFDLYAIKQLDDGNVEITTVTTNGFGDRYNHGLRIFATTDDYLVAGTANPFLGTQIWRMAEYPHEEEIVLLDMDVDVTGYSSYIDGTAHGITVKVNDPSDAYIYYSEDGVNYVEEPLMYVSGEHTVYVQVVADGYNTFETSADVVLTERPVYHPVVSDPEPEVPAEPEIDILAGVKACAKDATCVLSDFVDLVPAEWYHDGVHFMVDSKLMFGVGDNKFAPTVTTSRAMVVTMLSRIAMIDEGEGEWYTVAMDWATKAGLIAADADPDAVISREEIVSIMYKYAKYKGYDVNAVDTGKLNVFGDAELITNDGRAAMVWAVENGIVIGDENGMIMPEREVSRAEVAALIQRLCEFLAK